MAQLPALVFRDCLSLVTASIDVIEKKENKMFNFHKSVVTMHKVPTLFYVALVRASYVMKSSKMSQKSVATCYWFQISFILLTYVNRI